MDETQEDISDMSPVFGFEEKRVFAVEHSAFQGAFADMVVEGAPVGPSDGKLKHPSYLFTAASASACFSFQNTRTYVAGPPLTPFIS